MNIILLAAFLIGQDLILDFESFRHKIGTSDCPVAEMATPPATALVAEDFVELRRSSCYGTCPDYTLRIHADGKVRWEGRRFVQSIGENTATIAPEKARALIEKFRTDRVWSLCGDYSIAVTDSVTYTTTIHIGIREKKISEYAESAPDWFHALENEIDTVADAEQWIVRDPKTELFAFVSKRTEANPYPEPGILPITSPVDVIGARKGVTELMAAVSRNDQPTVDRLIEQKSDVNAPDAGGWTALMYAAASSRPEMVRLLLAAGADVNAKSAMGQTAAMAAVSGYEKSVEVLRLLLQAGGDSNIQDNNGQTALMFAAYEAERLFHSRPDYLERAELLTFMRLSGARSDLRDNNGMSVFDALEQGANLVAGSGQQYDALLRILRDIVPGTYAPVKVSGRVVRPRDSSIPISGVRLERVGTGIAPSESPVSEDGKFEFPDVPQGVYTIRRIPSAHVRHFEFTVSVTNAEVSNLTISNPPVREILVEIEMPDKASPPAIGIVFESAFGGPAMGAAPGREKNSYSLSPNLVSAIAADGKAAHLQVIRLGGNSSDDLNLRVFLSESFSYDPVVEAERMPNGQFRITLAEGEYHIGAVTRPGLSVAAVSRGPTNLLANPLTISGPAQSVIHVKLEKSAGR